MALPHTTYIDWTTIKTRTMPDGVITETQTGRDDDGRWYARYLDDGETVTESVGPCATEQAVLARLDEFDDEDDSYVDEDGCCSVCGHPADGSSGHGSCDAGVHRR